MMRSCSPCRYWGWDSWGHEDKSRAAHPMLQLPLLTSASLSRSSWRLWSSSRRRKGHQPWKTSWVLGLKLMALSGISRG